MAIRNKATKAAKSTAYAGKRESRSRPTVKNVATSIQKQTAGAAADKHPKGSVYLAPKRVDGVRVINHNHKK